MKEFNFIRFILKKEELSYLREFEFDLSSYFYFYGDHFNKSPKQIIKIYLIRIISYFIGIMNRIRITKERNNRTIISDSYFTINDELSKLGLPISRTPWTLDKNNTNTFNLNLYKYRNLLTKMINSGIDSVLSKDFKAVHELFYENVYSYVKRSDSLALILPADATFSQRIIIKVFKNLNKPSFIYLHGGLPSSYDPYRFNLTDYLLVWGDKLKEEYVKNGFNREKLIVVGHPYYEKIPDRGSLRFELNSILVLSKPVLGNQKKLSKKALQDRSNSFLYLYELQELLKDFGVKNARLRLHPSENENWYKKNIDNSFFKIDKDDLDKSLSKSNLVIGPKSTVFIEALYYGVNYVFFEPAINNLDMNNLELTSPFDREDGKIPFATNIHQLKDIIKNKKCVDYSVLGEYIKTPFDLSEVVKIIEKRK
jgi:hypothetical protein